MCVRWDTIEGKRLLKERIQEITYYMAAGKGQKETAELVGISEKTLWKIKMAHPEHFKQVDMVAKGEIKNPFKMDNSLHVLLPWCRVNEPELYRAIMDKLPKFYKHLKLI